MIPDDFIRAGYLLDLNRRWAHPLGFEIVLARRVEAGELQIRDYRRESREPILGPALRPDAAEVLRGLDALRVRRAIARRDRLGSVLEPIPGRDPAEDGIAILGLADPEGAWAWVLHLIGDLVAEALEALGEALGGPVPGDLQAWMESALPGLLTQVLGRLLLAVEVTPDGTAHFSPGIVAMAVRLDEKTEASADVYRRLRAIGRCALQAPDLPDVPVYRELQKLALSGGTAELYPDEVTELEALLVEVDVLQGRERAGEDVIERRTKVQLRVEELYGLAQPGMRYWRGDREARGRFEKHRKAFKSAVGEALARRSAYQQLLLGNLAPEAVCDLPEVVDRLKADLEAAREELGRVTRVQHEALIRFERLDGLCAAISLSLEESLAPVPDDPLDARGWPR